jgi:hypothetical protein
MLIRPGRIRSSSRHGRKCRPKARLDELAEKFEEIEHQQFGKDGFDDALERIARIEQALGLADLRTYTASSPPRT